MYLNLYLKKVRTKDIYVFLAPKLNKFFDFDLKKNNTENWILLQA